MIRQDGLRATLYHRFHALVPLFASRVMRRLWRTLVWGFWIVYFGFVVLVLGLRYVVLPHIEDYRGMIERLASEGIGQSVSIGRIEASWEGINPDLTLLDVRVADAEGRPALAFSRIEAILSWWSVPSANLKLRLLTIDEPILNLRRDASGHFFIAGIPIGQTTGNNDLPDWILAQKRIRVRGATLVWEDDLRQAPALVLEDLNLAIDNDWQQHRFGLTALPPEGLAAKIDLRGEFHGRDFERLTLGEGQVYAEIDYTDLAVWRQWIDYPIDLPHGRGAFRAWFDVADGRLRQLTADLALQDVRMRLAQDLPALELERVSGRFGAKFTNGFAITGQRLELLTRASPDASGGSTSAAVHIVPTDFNVAWQTSADGTGSSGKATASTLDLGALAHLAAHLPIDAHSRQLLHDYAPRGQVSALNGTWVGDASRLQNYTLKAGFSELALKAKGHFPGFSGLSGALDVNEKGGSATLDSQKSTLDLPSVFPVPLIELDSLGAQARWTIDKGELQAELSRVVFAGPEAAGSAQGSYRTSGEGPGSIDLSASLSRADARAVWRYMPHAVGEGARLWLRDSLLAGHSNEAKLVLKGDLNDFPFLDKRKGQFLVTVKARDVVLDYGKGWPRINGISGDLRFEGNGMVVEAQRGTLLGAKLSHTRAEIPDFDAPISTLIIKGQADGPTSEFLKFIDQSPVAERIDNFTEDMRASGAGHLDLGLVIPLDETKLAESKIDGAYRLINNEVTVDAALPPFKQVNGSVQFSGSDLRVPEINATLFGGPLKIKGGTQKDGKVLITANGSVSVAQMRKQNDLPVLASLSGTVPYRGEVRINKRNADLVIDSMLVGLASTLPEPFNKAANEPVPLRFEKKLLPGVATSSGKAGEAAARDQLSASYGNALSLQFIRRKQGEGFVTERGAIAVGRPLQLPDSGVTFGLTAKYLDLDYWRRALRPAAGETAGGANGNTAGNTASTSFSPDSLNIKTPDLFLFGQHYTDVDLSAVLTAGQTRVRLASRQASGDLLWDAAGTGNGHGKLTARLKQLAIDTSAMEQEKETSEAIKELPALDIVADDFSLGPRRFGRLELQARNEGSLWRLNHIELGDAHGALSGSGQWQTGSGKSRTQLDFKIDSNDVGKFLERLGYPGTVRAGTAKFGGKVGWDGPPTSLDYASLSGALTLEAAKGQFLKLDPGAAGKLLGLISLQGLPRRITLDFRDVFSDGLAFDSIVSTMSVQNGLLRTDRLQIDGPSARVVLSGEVDLKQETQRLNVNVQPELGGTAALGVALVNPVAGLATLLAHKVFQNPLNQLFGYNYRVTGTWGDPKVEKVSANSAAPAMPEATGAPNAANPNGARNESSAK